MKLEEILDEAIICIHSHSPDCECREYKEKVVQQILAWALEESLECLPKKSGKYWNMFRIEVKQALKQRFGEKRREEKE